MDKFVEHMILFWLLVNGVAMIHDFVSLNCNGFGLWVKVDISTAWANDLIYMGNLV